LPGHRRGCRTGVHNRSTLRPRTRGKRRGRPVQRRNYTPALRDLVQVSDSEGVSYSCIFHSRI
jgi:hypothetical protein